MPVIYRQKPSHKFHITSWTKQIELHQQISNILIIEKCKKIF